MKYFCLFVGVCYRQSDRSGGHRRSQHFSIPHRKQSILRHSHSRAPGNPDAPRTLDLLPEPASRAGSCSTVESIAQLAEERQSVFAKKRIRRRFIVRWRGEPFETSASVTSFVQQRLYTHDTSTRADMLAPFSDPDSLNSNSILVLQRLLRTLPLDRKNTTVTTMTSSCFFRISKLVAKRNQCF